MTQTIVANIKVLEETYPDWRNDPDYIYIGRANRYYGLKQSKWHNPNRLHDERDRESIVNAYRHHLSRHPELLEALPELRGKVLVCYCHPKSCHGDVLAALVNKVVKT